MAKKKHYKDSCSPKVSAHGNLMVVDATRSTNNLNGEEKRYVVTSLKRKRVSPGETSQCKVRKISQNKMRKHSGESITLAADEGSDESELEDVPSFLRRISISSDDLEYENKVAIGQPSTSKQNQESSDDDNHSLSMCVDSEGDDNRASSVYIDSPRNLYRNLANTKDSDNFLRNKHDSDVSDANSTEMDTLSEICASGNSSLFKDNIHTIPVPRHNMEVVILNHPGSVVLHKYITVKVISGSVKVIGHQMQAESPPIEVFSSEKTGLITLITHDYDEVWKKRTVHDKVRETLTLETTDKIAAKILSKCVNTSVIIMLQRIPFPPYLQFLNLYYPAELRFHKTSVKHYGGFIFNKNTDCALTFDYECEELVEQIVASVCTSDEKSGGQRVVIFGPKDSGKSTLLRYLVNSLLQTFPNVFYLDADPGQAEFTPPGVISLFQLEKPILGPPFAHLRNPAKMIFIGSSNAATSPQMYQKSIANLMEVYPNPCKPGDILLVNTMGWLQGIGIECLNSLMRTIQPTIIIEVIKENSPSTFNCGEFLRDGVKYLKINSQKKEVNSSHLPARVMRDLSIMSYFGRCQSAYFPLEYLNGVKPFCISWDKIAIYIFGQKLVPHRIVEAINASLVALCNVDESLVLVSDVPGYQKTLLPEPNNTCLGFGIVRAVDELKHLLYVVTPLSLECLYDVNALIRGINILVPDAVFLRQNIYGIPLPYTDLPKQPPVHFRRKIKKRSGSAKRQSEGS